MLKRVVIPTEITKLTQAEMMSIVPSYSRVLILGVGNWLMGDEGLGVHLAQRLQQRRLPPGVDVVDGGTGGFHLMEYFESYPCLILVDATLDGRPPGTIRLIEPRFSNDFPRSMSTHDIGLKDLINGLQVLGRAPKIYLFVVSIAELRDMYIGLSPEIETAAAELEERILGLCGELRQANRLSA